MKDLSYAQLSLILDSWEKVRRIPNYRLIVGTSLYRKLFDRDVESKTLFGWPKDIDTSSPDLLESKRFHAQAQLYVRSLDAALDMIGPDTEMMTEIMTELGARHYRHYGVGSHLYPIMGECLLETLEKTLKDEFTEAVRSAFWHLWTELSKDMTRGEEEYLMASTSVSSDDGESCGSSSAI